MGFVLVSSADCEIDDGRALRARRAATAAGLEIIDLTRRCWIAGSGPTPLRRITVGAWVLIGDVIDRRQPPIAAIPDDDGYAYERKMLARFWGRFVGVKFASDGDVAAVVRDPSGGLETYIWRDGPLTLVASDTPDWLIRTLKPRWRISDDRVLAVLHDPYGSEGGLLLEGPVAVTPGSLVRCHDDANVPLWRPLWIATGASSCTDREAADRLRRAVDEAVFGYARLGGALAAEISGGLDSSIVASTLAGLTGVDVRLWLNAWGPDAAADERPWVQALASHLSVSPDISPRATGRVTRRFLESMPQGIRPGFAALDGLHDADWAMRLRAAGVDRILTGKGGDALFIQPADLAVYTDLWKRRGWWRALTSPSLVALARLNERSVWTAVGQAISGRRPRVIPLANPLASPPGPGTTIHPWLEGTEILGPAKRTQILGLIQALGFHGPSLQTEVAAVMHPLVSQPVVETCLALPTDQLTLGQRDRALARQAFADRLPAAIIDRRSKGEMTAFYGRMIADGLEDMREWLLDGELASRGLINRIAAEALLTRESLAWRGAYVEIMTTAAVEGWVRAWGRRLS